MRAVLIKDGKGPVENLYLGEEATPEPEEGQVQVQVSSSRLVVELELTCRSK
jgi:NADPH:quinone reductase-like Zn-dependent oxidoreductase